MSISITIGETIPASDTHYTDVERLTLAEAPNLPGDDYTGQTNHRSANTVAWLQFAERVGLVEYFRRLETFGGGVVRLESDDYREIHGALLRYQRRYRGAQPGFIQGYDPNLARLMWLVWWMGYALKHCNCPALRYSF